MKPEYDLERLLWDIHKITPIKIIYRWVKGHQNELKNGTKIHGPFEKHVQLNIKMDCYASNGCRLPSKPREMYTHTKMAFYTKEGVMVTDFESFLYKKINGSSLHTYITEKYDWDESIMKDIQWRELGEALNSYTAHR